jgi:hypothetical protein
MCAIYSVSLANTYVKNNLHLKENNTSIQARTSQSYETPYNPIGYQIILVNVVFILFNIRTL